MFLLKEILFCAPLIIYAVLSIWRLIRQRSFKIVFLILFVLLVAAFPVVEKLSHSPEARWADLAMIAGYFSLPLLLYLIVFVILTDLAVGMARLAGILSKKTVHQRRFRKARLLLCLVGPVLTVTIGAVRNNSPQVKEYSIQIPRKSSDIRQLRIAFASDFHLRETTARGLIHRYIEKVNEASPDIVLIGGDLLEGDRPGERLEDFAAQFRRLRAKFGIYGIAGNHDLHGTGPKTFFNQAGIHLLQDGVERIGDAFYLVGRNDQRVIGRKSIGDLLEHCEKNLPVVVLDHRPTDLENIGRAGPDLLLSGHTHNGQLFPVNLIVRRYYELCWGYKLKNQTHVIVTSGLQVWGPPVRTAGDSEIVIVNVSFVSGKQGEAPLLSQ
jgi:uncharacterized protein